MKNCVSRHTTPPPRITQNLQKKMLGKRKYINRQGNEEFDQEMKSDEDENKKLERLGPVLDIVDPFEIITVSIKRY